jgi:hypothetical protein
MCNWGGNWEVIYGHKETINAKSKKTKIYQENKPWSQVNIHLQKLELIMETKRQFIL